MVGVGDVLLTEEPFVHVLVQKERGKRCDWCFSVSTDLKRCTACRCMRYCSVQCQRKDWSIHKSECGCLKAVHPKIPKDSVRLLLRIALKSQISNLQHSSTSQSTDGIWKRSFSDLMTNREAIQEDQEKSAVFAQMIYTLKELTGDRLELPSPKELFTMYCKMTINSFTICDGEMQGIGTGIYLQASRLDHSCQPNAVVTFSGTTLSVRATVKVDRIDPSEVYISYIDQRLPTVERRKQLWHQYYFHCDCWRCQDSSLDELMLSVKCPHCSGPVIVTDDTDLERCKKCSFHDYTLSWQQEVRRIVTSCEKKVKEAEKLNKEGDHTGVLEMCRVSLTESEKILDSHNYHQLQLLDLGLDACIQLENWEEGLEYGLKTLPPYRKLLPAYSPVLGVQLMKIGKIQLYLEKLYPAVQSLQQAEDILHVTHGRSHDLSRDLQIMIDQCQDELRVKQIQSLEDRS